MHALRSFSRWPTPGLCLHFSYLALLVLHFELLRCCLWHAHKDLASSAASSEIATAFAVGLKFDLAAAAYVGLALLPAMGLARAAWGVAGERKSVVAAAVIVGGATSVLGMAEIEFYREFGARYNNLALKYWSQAGTVMSMIWHGYPVVRYVLLAACLTALHVGSTIALSRFWRGDAVDGAFVPRRASPRRAFAAATRLAGASCLLVLAARGGWRATPLKWGDAVHGDQPFANHLAQNGVWSLAQAMLSPVETQWQKSMWPTDLPMAESHRLARELLATPGESWAGSDANYPLLRVAHSQKRVSLAKTDRPPNVVVILMESFSARFCGACGAGRTGDDLTPEFDRLARQGVLFERCFSASSNTHQANVGVLAGFPILPGHEALMEDAALGDQPFEALPAAFAQRGYSTLYLYNGDFAWENMRGFFRGQGMQRFIGVDDFDAAAGQRVGTWGVSDNDLFARANEEFRQAKEPFFGVVLTLSNHAPFDLPEPLPFEPTTGHGSLDRRLDGLRYADWAIGQFFARARREPYFENTLFVLVGDHGFSMAPHLTDLRLLRFHVPLLFYAPALLTAEETPRKAPCSHLDIAPTLLRLTGDEEGRQFWGRDLFALGDDDPGLAYFKPSAASSEAALVRGDEAIVKTNDGRTKHYRYDLGFPPRIEELPDASPERDELDAYLHAYLQTAASSLENRRVARSTAGKLR